MITSHAKRALPALVVGATALALLVSGCGAAAPVTKPKPKTTNAWLSNIEKNGVLQLAVMPDPPFMYENAQTGKWQGPYIQLLQSWAKSIHVKINYVANTYTTVIAAIQAGDVELAPGLSYTPARGQVVWFSNPSWEQIESFAINTQTTPGVTSWAQLNVPKYSVCSILGATEQIAYDANKSLYQVPINWQDSITTCNLAVTSGRNNAVFDNWIANAALAKSNPNIRLIFGPASIPRETSGSYVISKTYPQADIAPLNAWIAHVKADGQWAQWEHQAGLADALNYLVPGATVPAYVKPYAKAMFGHA